MHVVHVVYVLRPRLALGARFGRNMSWLALKYQEETDEKNEAARLCCSGPTYH